MSRLQQLQALLSESPEDSFLLFALAKEYEKIGEDAQALHFYERLQSQDPGYVGTYYHFAKLYEKREEYARALEIYEKGLQIAKQAGDHHASAELSAAKLNLELEL